MRVFIIILLLIGLADAFYLGRVTTKPQIITQTGEVEPISSFAFISNGYIDTANGTVIEKNHTQEERIEELKHAIWHYDEQAKALSEENQRMHQELIESGLYQLDQEVTTGADNFTVTLRSYKKVEPKTVEKIVYQQVPLREWQSLDEFLGMMPSVTPLQSNSCLWVAENIQKVLADQGYLVSIGLEWNGYYYGTCVRSRDYNERPWGHAGLLVDIQGSWYFYDPESKAVTKLF